MLHRLVCGQAQTVVRRALLQQTRSFRVSGAVAGGHGHHDGPAEPHIPVPSGLAGKTWAGEDKVQRISHFEYKPRPTDYKDFLYAAVGVVLTGLAITFYTDLFGKNVLNPNNMKKKEYSKPVAEQKEIVMGEVNFEKPAAVKETPKPVEVKPVEKKLVVNLVKEEKKKAEPVKVEKTEPEKPKQSAPAAAAAAKKDNTTVPESIEYLLVGSGTAAYYAALAIRAKDANAKVLMVGEEDHLPYNRPPLSKELWWYGDASAAETLEYKSVSGKTRDVFFEAEGFFVPTGEISSASHGGVSLLKGQKVVKLDAVNKVAHLESGKTIKYNKALIATGGKPRHLPELSGEDVKQKVLYLRGVEDYRQLDKVCKAGASVTIVGGGFLGSELAYGITRKYESVKVNQVFPESGNLASLLPEYLSKHATDGLKKAGVNVLSNEKVKSAEKKGDGVELTLSSGKKVSSDVVLVAVGIRPDTRIAEQSGFEVDSTHGGVAADAELRVRSGVWAAGDACSFFDQSLGRRRVEHWENAQISGRLAGENMTGAEKAFWYQPSFFTKISPDLMLNAVGNTDSSLKTTSVFAKQTDPAVNKFDKGIVFYTKENKVVGVLLVNVFGPGIDVARRLIEEARPVGDFKELAKLFALYQNDKQE